jgi:carbon starvation protein
LVGNEIDVRQIGYGSMMLESFVAVMALIAATLLDPGVYFAINTGSGIVGAAAVDAVHTISGWGFPVTVDQMQDLAKEMGESTLFARTGGAPSLAVGMASIFGTSFGRSLMSVWYHFAIMFEAVFILTTVDAGTRVGRFMVQELLGHVWKPLGKTSSYPSIFLSSAIIVGAWGYFLYQGVLDPLGGINSLWPLFGIANQILASVALVVATTIIFKMKKARYAFVTLVPLAWLATATLTASYQKIYHPDLRIGFLAQASALQAQLDAGTIAADRIHTTQRLVFNNQLDAGITGLFAVLLLLLLAEAAFEWSQILWAGKQPELHEAPHVQTAWAEVA